MKDNVKDQELRYRAMIKFNETENWKEETLRVD